MGNVERTARQNGRMCCAVDLRVSAGIVALNASSTGQRHRKKIPFKHSRAQ